MSMKSWKAEFYPVVAKSKEATASALAATEHSLRKWKGLRKEELEKHGVDKYERQIVSPLFGVEEFPLYIDDSSCALCERFYGIGVFKIIRCTACPLYKTLGMECDDAFNRAPYYTWQETGNPEPMIDALQRTVIMLKQEQTSSKES